MTPVCVASNCNMQTLCPAKLKMQKCLSHETVYEYLSACELAHLGFLMPLKFKVKVTIQGHTSWSRSHFMVKVMLQGQGNASVSMVSFVSSMLLGHLRSIDTYSCIQFRHDFYVVYKL